MHTSSLALRFVCSILLPLLFTIVLLLSLASASAAQESRVYSVPASIAADCSEDVTAALNEWIAQVPNGQMLMFGNSACYRVDGTLLFERRQGLTLEGNGATFKAAVTPEVARDERSQRKHLHFVDSRNIIVRNLRIEGTNKPDPDKTFNGHKYAYYEPAHESEHGLTFNNCHHVLVENVSVHGVYGDGLYIGRGGQASTYITVTNFTVSFNGRQGIGITWADHVLLERVAILNARRAGIDLEPAPGNLYVRNLEVRHSHLNARHRTISAQGRGDVSDVYVHHNTIVNPGALWLKVRSPDGNPPRRNWRVEHNQMVSPASGDGPVMQFSGVENVTIVDNDNPVAKGDFGTAILLEDVGGGVTITDNDFGAACRIYELTGSDVVVEERNNLQRGRCG